MKSYILFFLFLIAFFKTNAQTTPTSGEGTITGKVVDKNSKQPISYVNIAIIENGQTITGAVTKDNGVFTVKKLALKKYSVEIQFMGYKKQTIPVTLTSNESTVNLNTILLEEEAIELKGVEIVSERSTIVQKTDRKVINIGKDLIASGNTASEIMNNIPTVSVDPQTKEISLRGNTNVRVLIDGKPSNISAAQLLQQIPSSSIKQIELITNPSAKYNPEGMSGIINIILHKNTNNGFNGTVTAGATFAITPKVNTALNMNYKVDKVNFYTNYGLNHGNNASHGYINSSRPSLENNQTFESSDLDTSHLLKLGADYFLNEKNTLSFYTNLNLTNSSGDGLTKINYLDANLNDSKQATDSRSKSNTQTYDFDFKHEFEKKDENLEFQSNFSKTTSPELTNYDFTTDTPYSQSLVSNDVEQNVNYLQLNVDYVNPLTETTKLEAGAESRNQRITSELLEDTNLTTGTYTKTKLSSFELDRDIYSVYSNFGKQWKKWSSQVGLRLESYSLDGDFSDVVNSTDISENTNQNETITDYIFSFYPSAFLNYKANDKDSFNLNYSRRVDRPSVGQLNPIREWTTPLVESRGNPNLKPQFTNSIELNYTRTIKMGTITAGVFHRLINDEIIRVIYKNPDNINQDIISYDNFENNHASGIEASANLKLTKWWSINASSDAYFKIVKGTVENGTTVEQEYGEVDVLVFNARMNNNFTATKKLRFNLFSMYRGRDLSLQFQRNPMYKADAGATYTILNGNGSITARANDIFSTMHFSFNGNIPYQQSGAFYWESHSFYIGFNYNFGSGKNKALERKERDGNESQGSGGPL